MLRAFFGEGDTQGFDAGANGVADIAESREDMFRVAARQRGSAQGLSRLRVYEMTGQVSAA